MIKNQHPLIAWLYGAGIVILIIGFIAGIAVGDIGILIIWVSTFISSLTFFALAKILEYVEDTNRKTTEVRDTQYKIRQFMETNYRKSTDENNMLRKEILSLLNKEDTKNEEF